MFTNLYHYDRNKALFIFKYDNFQKGFVMKNVTPFINQRAIRNFILHRGGCNIKLCIAPPLFNIIFRIAPMVLTLYPPSTPVSLPGPVRNIHFALSIAIYLKYLHGILDFFKPTHFVNFLYSNCLI